MNSCGIPLIISYIIYYKLDEYLENAQSFKMLNFAC